MTSEVAAVTATVNGRGHKRRSRWLTGKFLVLFLAIATLLGGAALVAPQFQEKASAIDDANDITWDINGGVAAYDAMIDAVRQRATGGRVLREGVLETDPSLDPANPANIFAINLRASALPSSSDGNNVRLIVRARDLFIIGYQIRAGRGRAAPVYFRGDNPTNDRLSAGEFNSTGSYHDLEQKGGKKREGLTLNQELMNTEYTNLRDNAAESAALRSMMVFIVVIAEAARFDPLQQQFRQAFDPNGGEREIQRADALLMNNWARGSTQMLNSLNSGAAINFQVNDPDTTAIDYQATTLQGLAAILAICLLQNSQG